MKETESTKLFEKLGDHVAIGSLWKARRKIYMGPVHPGFMEDEWVTVFSLKPSKHQGRFAEDAAYYWDVELLGCTKIAKMPGTTWYTWMTCFWTQEELDRGDDSK